MDIERSITSSIAALKSQGMQFESGLTATEVTEVETELAVKFPLELRFFLEAVLPVGLGYPNWRCKPAALASRFISGQIEDLLFDVESNEFWRTEWGIRPTETNAAIEEARSYLSKVPLLIPIHNIQYVKCVAADQDDRLDNPVFSVQASAVLHCGRNLAHYLEWWVNNGDDPQAFVEDYSEVPFWTDLARENCEVVSKPYWPVIIDTIYPEYEKLKNAASGEGFIAEILKPDGLFGVSFRILDADPLRFWVARRDSSFVLGLYGSKESPSYRLDTLDDAIEMSLAAMRRLKSRGGYGDLQEMLDSRLGDSDNS